MDANVVSVLEKAGIDPAADWLPEIGIELDEKKQLKPLGPGVLFRFGETAVTVELKPLPQLFAGSRVPPSFKKGPTPEYVQFFQTLEDVATACGEATGCPEYDVEFERLFSLLRRRPAGHDANPLFSYLQAAAGLYMSLHVVSQAEFEAVVQRLSRSAAHFAQGSASTNYAEIVGQTMAPIRHIMRRA